MGVDVEDEDEEEVEEEDDEEDDVVELRVDDRDGFEGDG